MKRTLILLAFLPTIAFSQEDEFSLDQEYTIDPDGTLELTCNDAEVRIVGSDRTTAHVVIQRKITVLGKVRGEQKFDVAVSEQDGNLTIEEQRSGNVTYIGTVNEDYTINVEAPRGVSLRLHGDDGPLVVQQVDGAIAIDNDDGDVVLQDCGGATFAINVDDGNIAMNQGQGTLSITIDDGDVAVQQGAFTQVDVSADDGNVALITSLADQGEYQVKVSDGEVNFQVTEGGGEFDIRHDDTKLNSTGPFTLVKSDDDHTQLSLPNGSANVDISIDDGHVELQAL